MKIINSSIFVLISLLWLWSCQKEEVPFSKPEPVVYHLKVEQQKPVYLKQEGGEMSFSLQTNAPLEITTPPWIHLESTLDDAPETHPLKDSLYHYKYTADANIGGVREDTIFIRGIHGKDTIPHILEKIVVIQQGVDADKLVMPDDSKLDIQLKVAGATASSVQGGSGKIEYSFDNNPKTMYHSNWNNWGEHYFPITLTYHFSEPEQVDYIVYVPRNDGSRNGIFKRVKLQYSQDNVTYKDFKTFEMPGNARPYQFKLAWNQEDGTLQQGFKAKYVRFVVEKGLGDNQGFASAVEIKFFQFHPDRFDYHALFTDASCSELRAGITKKDIDACKDGFYQNIAYKLYQKSYPTDFRIADYKAYTQPEYFAQLTKTTPYSVLDNPTGISVKQGEELVVLVGDTHERNIGIRVQNLDKPNGDGFGGPYYPLTEGLNKIRMQNKGLVYIMYHTAKPEPDAPTIRVHLKISRKMDMTMQCW